ncbi:hypothetical protein [Sulfitobacter aestuariivivens]|uniref:RiboL-PSP-HEPN domain-containing protein n=1 Tax=Sulfitobacter aestuariivivens TaxID=2766981 RepID=A0A927D684_9RHOB|nr:hypothetical protein [Sulfitobacter aestuariivivens]MBD3665970.1 hypothetical protein [Sulfitobacter aestuariivivens]
MSEFENYSNELLQSSKEFLLQAKNSKSQVEEQRLFRASLTHAFFFLESQLNYIASHFENSVEFSTIEKSLLRERDIALEKGRFVITERQKYYNLEDRIEFLLARFAENLQKSKGDWFSNLKTSIAVRNRLVHPKNAHKITHADVERAILAALGCLSALYHAIFGKPFPPSALGLHLGPETQ